MAGIEAKVSFSNGFDYSNLPLQIVRPSLRPALTKICMQKYVFCVLQKKIMRKWFHWQAFYYWRNYTTQQITSSPLMEFGTRIPIRILEDFWSEFLIIFIEKKTNKQTYEVWLPKLFIKTAGSVHNPKLGILIYLGKYNEIKKNIETSQFTHRITVEE